MPLAPAWYSFHNLDSGRYLHALSTEIGHSVFVQVHTLLSNGLPVLKSHDQIYNQDYYDTDVEQPATQAAGFMAASMLEHFRPDTIVDVGCGTGALLAAFNDLGCTVSGLEYAEAGLAYCRKRHLPVRKFNIAKDEFPHERHDLAVSFEIAEHLPPWSADRFVDLLCQLSSHVVMSAATPGQGGTSHINEQQHA